MHRLTVALACGLALAASGCGGDDEESTDRETSTPIPTVPEQATDTQTDTQPDPATETLEEPVPEPPAAEDPSGGAVAPAPVPDTPDNDTPPPEDSPAERFEQFCADNPGACEN